MGWVSDEEVASGTAAADVAMRDPLRRDEGSVAAGYTVEEAVLLLSSTHSHLQRAGATLVPCLCHFFIPASFCRSLCEARLKPLSRLVLFPA